METRYTITEMAGMLGVHIQTLRKYEQDFGLLIPRDETNSRYYTEKEKVLFENIIKMKNEGLGTKAILTLMGRSVDAVEQREQALELISLEHLTGQDLQILVKKAFADTLRDALAEQEEKFERKIETLQAEHRQEMERLFEQQGSENEKLQAYIRDHRKDETQKLEAEKKKLEEMNQQLFQQFTDLNEKVLKIEKSNTGFWSRLFGK